MPGFDCDSTGVDRARVRRRASPAGAVGPARGEPGAAGADRGAGDHPREASQGESFFFCFFRRGERPRECHRGWTRGYKPVATPFLGSEL